MTVVKSTERWAEKQKYEKRAQAVLEFNQADVEEHLEAF